MKHPRTWYIVADGGRARIVQKREDEDAFDTQRELVSTEIHSHTQELGTDRPGRTHESAMSARHARLGTSAHVAGRRGHILRHRPIAGRRSPRRHRPAGHLEGIVQIEVDELAFGLHHLTRRQWGTVRLQHLREAVR